jgi:hypothetical protein
MRKLILAAFLLAFFVPAAYAQQGDPNREAQDAAEKREKAALDRQYRNALKNVPAAAQTKNDPWAQMRAPSEPNAASGKK